MPRQKLNWSLERSRIQADRSAPIALAFTWRSERNSFGDTIWFGYDAEGRHQGSASLIDRKVVARAFIPGTLDQVRIGEFPMSPVGLRQAQAAVEQHIVGDTASVSEAA